VKVFVVTFLFGLGLVGSLRAEPLKLLVNHAPEAFSEVLKKIDTDNIIVVSGENWFPPSEADVWVYFIGHKSDVFTFPELVQRAQNAVIDISHPQSLIRLNSPTRGDLRILLVDMTKVQNMEEFGIDFQSCLAAHEILRVALEAKPETGSSLGDKCEYLI